jgi:amidase
MARHVRDLYPILKVISGPDMRDPFTYPVPLEDPKDVTLKGLRLGWHSDNGLFEPTTETQATVRAAVEALEDVGLSATETVPTPVTEVGDQIWALGGDEHDGHAWMDRLLEKAGTRETHPLVAWTRNREATVSSGEFTALLERRDQFRSEMLTYMEDYDILVTPVAGFPALPYGKADSLELLMGFSYTHIHNLTGWPGVVVRCGTSPEGLPIGVQVIARPWAEHVALAVSEHLEEVFGGWQIPKLAG